MRVSELSRRSGVSVPTIKFYLRERLLPPGHSASVANQADYGDSHLHRLQLVKTLLTVGGLSVAAVRRTLAALDDVNLSTHEVIASAHNALPPHRQPLPSDTGADQARRDVSAFLEARGWSVGPHSHAGEMLADALAALRRLGRNVDAEVFAPYAELADRLAQAEVASLDDADPRERLLEDAVVGTVIFEVALVALRRLAQEMHSAARFG